MVTDPYVTLGVSRDASPEEIKKAYRKKAKQYHPDLHPNDPNASEKMNEINEAYDMLCNPEKYSARDRQQSSYQQARQQYQNTQQGASGTSGNQSNQQYGGYRGYQGQGGWNSDFGFDFEDLFRQFAGYGNTQTNTQPQAEAGDSKEIRMAIDAINSRRCDDAKQILTRIPSSGRDGRWYYLYAVACKGSGENDRAIDFMQRAVQLDPNNRMYHQLLNQYRSVGQTYSYGSYGQQRQRQTGGIHTFSFGKIIIGFFLLQFFLRLLMSLLGGGMGGGFFIF